MDIKEFLENQNAQYAQMIALMNRMMIENMNAINSIREHEKAEQENQADYPHDDV